MLAPRFLQNFRNPPLRALAPRKGRSKFPRALPGVAQKLIVVVTVIAVVVVVVVVTGFNLLALIAKKSSRWDFLSSLPPTWPTPSLSLLVDLGFIGAAHIRAPNTCCIEFICMASTSRARAVVPKVAQRCPALWELRGSVAFEMIDEVFDCRPDVTAFSVILSML